MMRLSGFRLFAIALLGMLLVGCGGSKSLTAPTPLQAVDQARVQPQIIWSSNGGNGAGGQDNDLQVGIAGHTAYVANRSGEVAAFDIESGKRVWRHNTKKHLVSGPTVSGNVLLVGSRDGHLLALSSADGHALWQANAASEIIAAPAAHNGIAVVRTLDGRVVAYKLDSGSRLWTVERNVPNLTMRGASAPIIDNGRVYAGLDNGDVVALALATGQQYWQQTIALPVGRTDIDRLVDIDAGLLIADNALYAVSVGGKLASLSLGNGRVRWKQDVASATGLAFNQKLVFVTDLDGVVYAVNRLTGAVAWSQDALKYRKLSAPAMANGYLVVGDYDGYLHWVDPSNGQIVGRVHALGSAIRSQPVVVGNRVLVLGSGGDLAAVHD